ncbi:hypothetical protein ACFV0G_18655, partial [Kitasatospora sp. NPDC059571]
MSVVYISLLLILIAVATAVLLQVRALARRLGEREAAPAGAAVDEAAIRRAVVEALAADREREITEARAFWAEQEARAAEDGPVFDGPFLSVGEEWPLFFPRPTGPEDAADNATMDPGFGEALRNALEDIIKDGGPEGGVRPGHPSQGGGVPHPADAGGDVRARREADLIATGLEAGLLDAETEPATAPDPRRPPAPPDYV